MPRLTFFPPWQVSDVNLAALVGRNPHVSRVLGHYFRLSPRLQLAFVRFFMDLVHRVPNVPLVFRLVQASFSMLGNAAGDCILSNPSCLTLPS